MKPCTGCRHLVRLSSGLSLCKWPERKLLHWVSERDPYTGRSRTVYRLTPEGAGYLRRTEYQGGPAFLRPTVREERENPDRCGPDAVHWEPNFWRRLWARVR